MAARASDFVTELRQATTAMIDDLDKLRALRREWDAVGYSGTITAAGGFEGANADIDEAKLASVFTTLAALETLLAAGHATNLYGVHL